MRRMHSLMEHFEFVSRAKRANDIGPLFSGWCSSPGCVEGTSPDSPVSVTPQPEMWHSVPEGKGSLGRHMVFTYLDSRAQ